MGNMIGEEDEETSDCENEYFDLIHKKKEKDSKITQEQEKDSKNKTNKFWKDVILHFLEKQYKLGISWCKELHRIIKTYPFTSHKKFLDSFALQKFEVKTKPKCLDDTRPLSLNASMSMPSGSSDEMFNDSSSNNLKTSKSLNEITSSQYLSELSKNEYKKNKEKLNEYINIFKKDLKNEEHPITICIKLFVEIFSSEIKLYTGEKANGRK